MAKKASKKPMTGKAMKKTKGGLAVAKYEEALNVNVSMDADASLAADPALASRLGAPKGAILK